MPRLICLDNYYPAFLNTLRFHAEPTYQNDLRRVLDMAFGTGDFVTRHLRNYGWETADVIVNCEPLQAKWGRERGIQSGILESQITEFKPDFIFLQDVSISLPAVAYESKIVAQISCPWPGDEMVKKCGIVLTSFPHYIPRIEALNVLAVYLPLAFEPSVLEGPQPERDIDISFVGGVGASSHWKRGTDTLEAVAEAFPTRFQWWGYGSERLPASSALRGCYKGAAWGRDQYAVYRRSKIVLNRHGEIALGFSQNLRQYEATGCGAMLLTDNWSDLFVSGEVVRYESAEEAIEDIEYFLTHDSERAAIAANGQARTLRDHTYARRMKVVSDTLQEMLYGSKAKLARGTILMQGNGDTPERFLPIDKLEDAYRE